MKRYVGFIAGAGLLLAAFGVAATTPADDFVQAPFGARGGVGDRIVSAHLIGTVNEASLAHEVELNFWEGTTSGIWLVADLTLSATVEPSGVGVDVFIDGVRYPATSRASSDTLDGAVVDPGFPVTGPILVELPADVLDLPGARSALLRIGPGSDPSLDSVIELVIDLTRLEIDDRVELESIRPGER